MRLGIHGEVRHPQGSDCTRWWRREMGRQLEEDERQHPGGKASLQKRSDSSEFARRERMAEVTRKRRQLWGQGECAQGSLGASMVWGGVEGLGMGSGGRARE